MNKKLIVSGVLAALMMGSLTGVQAVSPEENSEAVKAVKAELTEAITSESNWRKYHDNELDTKIKKEVGKAKRESVLRDLKLNKSIEANNIAINNQISNIKGAYESIKDINKTLEDSGARATAEATRQAREAAAAAQEVADGMTASQAAQDKNIEKNTKDIAEGKIALQNQISNIKGAYALIKEHDVAINNQVSNIRGAYALIKEHDVAINNQVANIRGAYALIKEHDVAINNQVANIRQSFELIKENKTGIEANKTAIAALDKKLTGADVALGGRIDQLATDTDKGLAKASALAALHPFDFDPSSKLNFAVAGGFYNGENAVALGAFYRPNRNVMLSFGSSIAGGENAYNVGLSVKVGKGGDRINQSNTTISELYDLVGRLQDQVAEQQKKIEELQAK